MTTPIQSRRCPRCSQSVVIQVSDDAALRYYNGAAIPAALSELTAEERERLISGLHGKCWEAEMDAIDEQFARDLDEACGEAQ
jgi:hypothetical protein